MSHCDLNNRSHPDLAVNSNTDNFATAFAGLHRHQPAVNGDDEEPKDLSPKRSSPPVNFESQMVAEIAAARRRLSSNGGHVTVDHEGRGSRPGSAGSSGKNAIFSLFSV